MNYIHRLFAAAIISSMIPVIAGATEPTISGWKFGNGATGSSTNATYDALFSAMDADVLEVWYNSTNVWVKANSIPSHDMGPWSPRTDYPTEQNNTWKFSRTPSSTAGSGASTNLGAIAVFVNGVQIFNWSDSTTYESEGKWSYLAPINRPDVDDDGGHPAPGMGGKSAAEDHTHSWTSDSKHTHATKQGAPTAGGAYHYHTYAPSLGAQLGDSPTVHSHLLGFAFDGNPIYGPYGYTNVNGTGAIKRMESSYQLRTSMTVRNSTPSGTSLPANEWGPTVGGSTPLGTFAEDYVYTVSSGDLDAYNGRFCVTPDYPAGVYAYFCTIDASGNARFPYTIGPNQFYGNTIAENIGMGAGHTTIPGGAVQYNPLSGLNDWKEFSK